MIIHRLALSSRSFDLLPQLSYCKLRPSSGLQETTTFLTFRAFVGDFVAESGSRQSAEKSSIVPQVQKKTRSALRRKGVCRMSFVQA